MKSYGRKDEGRERREESKRASLMRPKVEQTAAATRYFKASFTDEIDLIEGIARNENRMRSTRTGRRHDFTRVFVRSLSVYSRRKTVPDRDTAAGETDPLCGSFADGRLDLCECPGDW